LLFPSGLQANLAAMIALVIATRPGCLADRLIHHSLCLGAAPARQVAAFRPQRDTPRWSPAQQQRRESAAAATRAHRKACSAWRTSPELAVIAGLCQNLRALLL